MQDKLQDSHVSETVVRLHSGAVHEPASESFQPHLVDIGILAIPKPFAQHMADMLLSFGVSAIWNFAPVKVENFRYAN